MVLRRLGALTAFVSSEPLTNTVDSNAVVRKFAPLLCHLQKFRLERRRDRRRRLQIALGSSCEPIVDLQWHVDFVTFYIFV